MEKWKKWLPIENLLPKYNIFSIFDYYKGLEIILSDINDNENKIKIIFDGVDISYRRVAEGFRYKKILEIDDVYGKEFYSKWTFFTIYNSKYIEWLNIESCGIYENFELKHFYFLCADAILDVISMENPIIEIL